MSTYEDVRLAFDKVSYGDGTESLAEQVLAALDVLAKAHDGLMYFVNASLAPGVRNVRTDLDQVRSLFDEDALTAQSRVKLLERQLAEADEVASRACQERDEYKRALEPYRLADLRAKVEAASRTPEES